MFGDTLYVNRAKYHKLKYGTDVNQGDMKPPVLDKTNEGKLSELFSSLVFLLYENQIYRYADTSCWLVNNRFVNSAVVECNYWGTVNFGSYFILFRTKSFLCPAGKVVEIFLSKHLEIVFVFYIYSAFSR